MKDWKELRVESQEDKFTIILKPSGYIKFLSTDLDMVVVTQKKLACNLGYSWTHSFCSKRRLKLCPKQSTKAVSVLGLGLHTVTPAFVISQNVFIYSM